MPALLVCSDSSRPTSGETVQYYLSWIGEDLDKTTYQELRLLCRMVALLVLAYLIVQDVLHLSLTQEVEGLWPVEVSTIIDQPDSDLMAASEAVLPITDLRIGLVEDYRIAKREESLSLHLICQPPCITVTEEQDQTGIGLQYPSVLFADLEDERYVLVL